MSSAKNDYVPKKKLDHARLEQLGNEHTESADTYWKGTKVDCFLSR